MSRPVVALLSVAVVSPLLMGLKYVEIPHPTPAFLETGRDPLKIALVRVDVPERLQERAAEGAVLDPAQAVPDAVAYQVERSNGQLELIVPGSSETPDALLSITVESWMQTDPARANLALVLHGLDGSLIHEQKVKTAIRQGFHYGSEGADSYARVVRTFPPVLDGVQPQNYQAAYEMEGRWYLMADGHEGRVRGPTDPELGLLEAARDGVGTFFFSLTDHVVTEDMIMAGGKNWDGPRSLLMKGEYDEAIAGYQAVVDAKPGKHKSLFELAKAFWAKGDLEKAVETMTATYEARGAKYYHNQLRYMRSELEARRSVSVPAASDVPAGSCFDAGAMQCCMAASAPEAPATEGGSEAGASPSARGAPLAVPAGGALPAAGPVCDRFGAVECCVAEAPAE